MCISFQAELRDQGVLGNEEEHAVNEELPEVKDLRSNKKKENKEKQIKKKAVEVSYISTIIEIICILFQITMKLKTCQGLNHSMRS